MIEYGANDWNWGLTYACSGRHSNIVKLMIEKGANNLDLDHIHMFIRSDMIDSNIVDLIIQNRLLIGSRLSYPKDGTKISKLLELGLPIDNLKNINGFDNLVKEIRQRLNIVKHILFSHLVKDLTAIVSEYTTD